MFCCRTDSTSRSVKPTLQNNLTDFWLAPLIPKTDCSKRQPVRAFIFSRAEAALSTHSFEYQGRRLIFRLANPFMHNVNLNMHHPCSCTNSCLKGEKNTKMCSPAFHASACLPVCLLTWQALRVETRLVSSVGHPAAHRAQSGQNCESCRCAGIFYFFYYLSICQSEKMGVLVLNRKQQQDLTWTLQFFSINPIKLFIPHNLACMICIFFLSSSIKWLQNLEILFLLYWAL